MLHLRMSGALYVAAIVVGLTVVAWLSPTEPTSVPFREDSVFALLWPLVPLAAGVAYPYVMSTGTLEIIVVAPKSKPTRRGARVFVLGLASGIVILNTALAHTSGSGGLSAIGSGLTGVTIGTTAAILGPVNISWVPVPLYIAACFQYGISDTGGTQAWAIPYMSWTDSSVLYMFLATVLCLTGYLTWGSYAERVPTYPYAT